MLAVAADRSGGAEVLTAREVRVPEIDPNEILIAVNTAGVGGWDIDIREGWSPGGRLRYPLVLGTDGSGTVAHVGKRVRRFNVGDRVYGYTWNSHKGGFYAQYVAVRMDHASPIPIPPLDLKRAGATPASGFTALQGIAEHLDVKAGEYVMIHGASGAVGSLAVQFAKARGAKVVAVASGADGVALVKRLGADLAVDGHSEDFVEAALRFAANKIDAVLILGSGDTVPRCLDVLRRSGRLAYPNGVEPALRKRQGPKIIAYDAEVGARQFEKLNAAIRRAKLRVPIAAEFPLKEAAKAHRLIKQGHVLGKIVLRIES
jgi:NADPH:quinone reductase-like Zn-dependent oxidoreductase